MKVPVLLYIVQVLASVSPTLTSPASKDDIDNIKNTVSVMQQTLKSTVEELQSTKDELFAIKAELRSTTTQLISVKSDLKTFETKYENETKDWKLELDQGNPTSVQIIKEQMINITNMSRHRNVGFLVSSKFGDNGEDHAVSYLVKDDSNLKFSQVTLNYGDIYSTKSGTMTAPVTGVYLVWIDINMQSGGLIVKLMKSRGSEVIMQQSINSRVVLNTPVYLVKGEQVSAWISGYNYIMKDTRDSVFGGVLLREF